MLEQITGRVWYMHHEPATDRPSIGYVRGDKYAFAAEAGASPMHVRKFYAELQEKGLPLPDITGVSHSHWDHSYGICACRGMTVASALTNEILAREAAYGWSDEECLERVKTGADIEFCRVTRNWEYGNSPVKVSPADISIDGEAVFDLGGVHVRMIPCRGPHSADSVLYYVPEDRVLFMGDADCKDLFGKKWAFDANDMDGVGAAIDAIPYDIPLLRPFCELLKGIDFEYAVAGHADEVFTKAEILGDLEVYL